MADLQFIKLGLTFILLLIVRLASMHAASSPDQHPVISDITQPALSDDGKKDDFPSVQGKATSTARIAEKMLVSKREAQAESTPSAAMTAATTTTTTTTTTPPMTTNTQQTSQLTSGQAKPQSQAIIKPTTVSTLKAINVSSTYVSTAETTTTTTTTEAITTPILATTTTTAEPPPTTTTAPATTAAATTATTITQTTTSPSSPLTPSSVVTTAITHSTETSKTEPSPTAPQPTTTTIKPGVKTRETTPTTTAGTPSPPSPSTTSATKTGTNTEPLMSNSNNTSTPTTEKPTSSTPTITPSPPQEMTSRTTPSTTPLGKPGGLKTTVAAATTKATSAVITSTARTTTSNPGRKPIGPVVFPHGLINNDPTGTSLIVAWNPPVTYDEIRKYVIQVYNSKHNCVIAYELVSDNDAINDVKATQATLNEGKNETSYYTRPSTGGNEDTDVLHASDVSGDDSSTLGLKRRDLRSVAAKGNGANDTGVTERVKDTDTSGLVQGEITNTKDSLQPAGKGDENYVNDVSSTTLFPDFTMHTLALASDDKTSRKRRDVTPTPTVSTRSSETAHKSAISEVTPTDATTASDVTSKASTLTTTSSAEIKGNERKGNQNQTTSDEEHGKCSQQTVVAGNMKSPQLRMTSLQPDSNYLIYIAAVSDAGVGENVTLLLYTNLQAPTEVKVTQVSDSWFTVTWTPPETAPDDVTYDVSILDMGLRDVDEHYDPENSFVFTTNYSTTGINVTSLTPYWRYNVTVKTTSPSSPTRFSALIGLDTLVETSSSVPGKVNKLHVVRLPDNYTTVELLWNCPDPRDRHTTIVGFLASVLLLSSTGNMDCQRYYVPADDADCDVTFSQIFSVMPEFQYVFKVLTLGADHNATDWQQTPTYIAASGKSEAASELTVTNWTTTSISVSWTMPSVTNGRLTAYYLLVFNASQERVMWFPVAVDPVSYPNNDWLIAQDQCLGTHKAADVSLPRVTLNVTLLLPNTSYIVSVYPLNREGYGVPARVDIKTPPLNYPTRFGVTIVNTTVLNVHWIPPYPSPGVLTTYSLAVSKVSTTEEGVELDRVVHFDGWNNTSTTLTDLRSGWVYYLLLTVESGDHLKSLQLNVTMPESPPGQVQNLKVLPVPDFYRKLLVTWDYPTILERHGHIANFTIQCESATDNHTEYAEVESSICEDHLLQEFCANITVQPGTQYKITVSAINMFRGSGITVSFDTESGPAPDINVVPSVPASTAESSQSTFKVSFCAGCLLNNSNGEITLAALVVCAAEVCDEEVNTTELSSIAAVQSMPTWKEAKGHNFFTLYRPTDDNFQFSVRAFLASFESLTADKGDTPLNALPSASPPSFLKLSNWKPTPVSSPLPQTTPSNQIPASNWNWSTPSDFKWTNGLPPQVDDRPKRTSGPVMMEVVIGADDGCGWKPADVFCNGPLPPGRSFRVLMVACTSVACSQSLLSLALHTLPSDDPFPTSTILASLLGVTAGITVVLLIVWWKRRRQLNTVKTATKVADEPEEPEIEEMTDRVPKGGVPMQNFEERLRDWKAGSHTEEGLPIRIVQQFSKLRSVSPDHSKQAALLNHNRMKNRYTNILPYDHSRVKLVPLDEEDPTSDYINANYIPGYHSKREYIATQGPLERTVEDFWRMVFEQRSPVIVMLSDLMEGRVVKVHKYYPDDDQLNMPCTCGLVTVILLNIQHYDTYLVRTFQVTVGGSHHTVKQFVITTWKDFEANLTPAAMIAFVRDVHQAIPPGNKYPIVTHCSAGVGRTGTFIAIDYFYHYINNNPPTAPVDIYDFVLQMRECRLWMVQSTEQYMFIHDVVNEMIRRRLDKNRYDQPSVGGRLSPKASSRASSVSDTDSAACATLSSVVSSSDRSADVRLSDLHVISDTVVEETQSDRGRSPTTLDKLSIPQSHKQTRHEPAAAAAAVRRNSTSPDSGGKAKKRAPDVPPQEETRM